MVNYQVFQNIINPVYIGVSIIAVVAIVFIVIGMVAVYRKLTNSRGLTIVDLTQQCDVNFDKNPDITNLTCCRDINGQVTDRKYIPDFDLVVSTIPRAYLSVCSAFCLQGLESDQKTCMSTGVGDVDSQQSKFNNCISLTKPIDCSGEVKPIAYQGAVKYYAYSAGEYLCKNKAVCN